MTVPCDGLTTIQRDGLTPSHSRPTQLHNQGAPTFSRSPLALFPHTGLGATTSSAPMIMIAGLTSNGARTSLTPSASSFFSLYAFATGSLIGRSDFENDIYFRIHRIILLGSARAGSESQKYAMGAGAPVAELSRLSRSIIRRLEHVNVRISLVRWQGRTIHQTCLTRSSWTRRQ